MDSVTQAALGAVVGEAVLGHKIGRKALAWGAILGTVPDLDVLIQFADPIASFTYHRGFSHSLLVQLAVSPLIAWLLMKFHAGSEVKLPRWTLFVFLCLSTHALLDGCTIYGTQLLWPLPFEPTGWGLIFIIDPLYTFPLVLGVVAGIILKRRRSLAYKINIAVLSISTIYLFAALSIKLTVNSRLYEQLEARQISTIKVLTTPMPFNILLWRTIVFDDDGYYEGYISVFDNGDLVLRKFESDASLLDSLTEHWPVQRLKWFTHGFFEIRQQERDIIISDIRMGAAGNYPFSFRVAEVKDGVIQPVASEYRRAKSYDVEDLRWVFRRITNEDLPLETITETE